MFTEKQGHLENIFDHFYRLQITEDRKYQQHKYMDTISMTIYTALQILRNIK